MFSFTLKINKNRWMDSLQVPTVAFDVAQLNQRLSTTLYPHSAVPGVKAKKEPKFFNTVLNSERKNLFN